MITSAYLLNSEACNMNCSYCFYSKKLNNEDVMERTKLLNMSNDTVKNTIDWLTHNSNKTGERINLVFFGGEPTLNMDAVEYAINYVDQLLEEKKLALEPTLYMVTNGLLYDKRISDWMIEKDNFGIQFSFDGVYQNYSRQNNSFDIVFGNLMKYKADLEASNINPGDKISVHSVVAPEYAHMVAENYKFMVEAGFEPWFIPTMEGDWGKDNIRSYIRCVEEIKIILRERVLSEMTLSAVQKAQAFFSVAKSDGYSRYGHSCGLTSGTLVSIGYNGDILPCHRLKTSRTKYPYYTNINGKTIEEINEIVEREKKKYFVKRSEMEGIHKCSECPAADNCFMCAASNSQVNGDIRQNSKAFCQLMLVEFNAGKELEQLIRNIGFGKYLDAQSPEDKLRDEFMMRDIKLTEIINKKIAR